MAEHSLHFYNFTVLDKKIWLKILEARNSSYVCSSMDHAELIKTEDHLRFCNNLKSDYFKKYFYITCDDEPYGVIDFVAHLNNWKSPEGGSYTFKDHFLSMRKVGDILNCYMKLTYGIAECRFKIQNSNLRALLPFVMKISSMPFTRALGQDDKYHYFVTELPLSDEDYRKKLSELSKVYDLKFVD